MTVIFPDTEFFGKVRSHDLETSWDAAAGQTRTVENALMDRIRGIFGVRGALNDSELVDEYTSRAAEFGWRTTTPQSIRSRRSQLHHAAKVRPTGEKRPSSTGGPSMVWELVK